MFRGTTPPSYTHSKSGLEASIVLFGLVEARGSQVCRQGFAERLGLHSAVVVSDEILDRSCNAVGPNLVIFAQHTQPAGRLVYGSIVGGRLKSVSWL